VSLDNRDYEPAPSRGYWIDASLRGASPITGSAYTFGAANLTARLYAPLNPERTVVLATRSVVDVIVGDAPVRELGRVGGLAEALAFGGLDLGRGVRLGRYPAPTKLLQQMEVRWDVMHVDVWHNDVGLMLAGFMDAGLLAFTPSDVGLHFGAGISGRIAWNKAFILRLDIGFSPDEGTRIGAYSSPNHPY
jgi:outer membrane protein assembly factor BamA